MVCPVAGALRKDRLPMPENFLPDRGCVGDHGSAGAVHRVDRHSPPPQPVLRMHSSCFRLLRWLMPLRHLRRFDLGDLLEGL